MMIKKRNNNKNDDDGDIRSQKWTLQFIFDFKRLSL